MNTTHNDITDAMKAIEWLLKSPDGQVLYGNAVDSDGFLYPDVRDSLSDAYKILGKIKATGYKG